MHPLLYSYLAYLTISATAEMCNGYLLSIILILRQAEHSLEHRRVRGSYFAGFIFTYSSFHYVSFRDDATVQAQERPWARGTLSPFRFFREGERASPPFMLHSKMTSSSLIGRITKTVTVIATVAGTSR
jgi:hypothetical protein